MKCDQDLCLIFWYDLKKLLWQDELNPRVRCAFGNVFPSFTLWHKTSLLVVVKNLSKAVLWSFSDRHLKQRHPFQTIWDMAYRRVFVSSIEIWILSLSHRDPWNFGQSMKDEMREEANMPGASRVIIGNILVLQEQIDPPAWSPVQEALWREIPMQIILLTLWKALYTLHPLL